MAKVILHARIDDDLHSWIKEEFPHGFIQVFVEQAFVNLRILVEEGRMPAPSEYARRASIETVAKLVKNQIESERENG